MTEHLLGCLHRSQLLLPFLEDLLNDLILLTLQVIVLLIVIVLVVLLHILDGLALLCQIDCNLLSYALVSFLVRAEHVLLSCLTLLLLITLPTTDTTS